jgi:ribosome biogenesis GTPase
MYKLSSLGWNSYYQNIFREFENNSLIPARVAVENKNNFLLYSEVGELSGELSGKLMFSTDFQSDLPKVGDWVLVNYFDEHSPAIIQEVLPRQTKLSRKVTGDKTDEQIIASNIDVIFIVQALDETFNINRIQRTIVMVNNSKAEPVVLLSKSDLCYDLESKLVNLKERIGDVKTMPLSNIDKSGIDDVINLLELAKTYSLIGPSGVGKSTLINSIMDDDVLETKAVREGDSKGRHTTTRRELVMLPNGALIIDTPGMRELQLWSDEESLNSVFPELDELSANCKYDDCTHTHEKECAVLEAIEDGSLSQENYDNYVKMLKEVKYLETRLDEGKQFDTKNRWKTVHKELKDFYKKNEKYRKR